MTEENQKLLEAAKPLIKLLAENYNPHTTAIVTSTEVELVAGVAVMRTDEFLTD